MSEEPDDRLLASYDLSAWEAPPPPANLVDRVIERVRVPQRASADAPAWKRVAIIAAGVLVAAAAVIALLMFGIERAPISAPAATPPVVVLRSDAAVEDAGRAVEASPDIGAAPIRPVPKTVVPTPSPSPPPPPTKASCDAKAAKAKADDYAANGMDTAALAQYEMSYRCKANATVAQRAALSACKAKIAASARKWFNTVGEPARAPLYAACKRNGITLDSESTDCDARAPKAKGDDYAANGMDTAALAQYVLSYRCKEDPKVARLAFLSACRAKNVAQAQRWWSALPVTGREPLKAVCARTGVTLDENANVTCDASKLKQEGDELVARGADTKALAKFEASLACRNDTQVQRLAFMSACKMRNATVARRWWRELETQANAAQLKQICIRYGIDVD